MNKSFAVVSLIAVAALAWGVFLWRGASDVPAPPIAEADGDAGWAEAPATTSSSSSAIEAADLALLEESPDEPDRLEVELEADPSPRLQLQIWDRKRGQVAAEADVYIVEGYEGDDFPDPFRPHLCEVAFAEGRRYKATSDGIVELSRLEERTLIAAQLPSAVGFRILDERHREREEITLRSDEAVAVRVVDQDGKPVEGVPVGVQQRVVDRVDAKRTYRDFDRLKERIAELRAEMEKVPTNQESLQWRLSWSERRLSQVRKTIDRLRRAEAKQQVAKGGKPNRSAKSKKGPAESSSSRPKASTAQVFDTRYEVKARRRTDARGVAVFRHFQFARHRQEKWWPEEHRDRFEAVLVMPLAAPVKAPFLGRPLPAEPVELRMPATGSVTLRTVDRDGRLFTHPVRGTLRIEGGDNPDWSRVQLRKEQDEAAIVFEHVGLGVQLVANCRLDDRDFRWQSPAFFGPTRPGERKVVDLVVAPDAAMLHGRVLDEAGEALASRELTFLINSSRGRLEGEEVVLDREGRFHLPYEPRDASVAPFRFQIRGEEHDEVPGFARTLPTLASEGVMDLGDLRLGALDQVAFGRVVDDLGAPIEDAHVQLQRERPSRRNREEMRFDDEAFTDAHTDDNGDFWLFGDVESARYRLRVRADGHFPHETLGVNRVTGTEIQMMRKARLVGTVTLPKWMPSKRVKAELRSLDDPERNRDDQIRDWQGGRYIYFDWVRPGLYSLSLRIQEFPEPFLQIDNLQVRPGDHEPHQRLRGLDLSPYFHRFEVLAVDEAGKRFNPESPLLARVTGMNGVAQFVGFSWKQGRVEIINSQPTLEVSPLAPGFRAEAAVLSAGRSELRFLRVPPITLRAPGIRKWIGDTSAWVGLRLLEAPKLARLDGRGGRSTRGFDRATSSYARLGANERARVTPLMDGRYRVAAYIGDKARGGLVEVAMGEVDVRVEPGGPSVVLQVQAAPKALQDAMREVLRRQAAAPIGGEGKGVR